jgi:hypothetical protein
VIIKTPLLPTLIYNFLFLSPIKKHSLFCSFMKYIISLILITIIFQSCNPEYRLARKFISSTGKQSVLVIPPTFLYKNKTHPLDTLDLEGLDNTLRDSAIYARSIYLKWIADTTFLRVFTHSFLNELSKYGLKVHFRESPETEEFIDWTVNFVQAQIEEEQKIISLAKRERNIVLSASKTDTILKYKRFLNNITSNTWLKVYFSAGNVVDSGTFFHSNTITDHVESGFSLNTYLGKPILIPKEKLRLADIYQLARMEGKIQAILFFDLMLNTYVFNKSKLFYYDYLHYDRELKGFSAVDDKKFEIIR